LLPNAIEFNDSFQLSTPLLERLALLRQLVQTIAQQHKAGIIQTDLHLKNFLLAHNSLYTVDTSSIRLQKQSLSPQKSLSSLALLLAQLDLMETKLKNEAIAWYFQLRGWDLESALLHYLNQQEAYWQKKREKTHKSKLFRAST